MKTNKEKIAIVGANSILAQSLYEKIKDEFEVFQVYHIHTDKIEDVASCIQINDFLSFSDEFKAIYFFSSVISFQENIDSVRKIFETNVKLLLQISSNFKSAKIIHSSSVSVFGNPGSTITEKTPVNPLSSYAFSKLWAEKIIADHFGGGVNLRMSSLFGKQMNENTFLPKIISDALNKKEITIFGDGSRKQNYIEVKQAANYFYKALSYNGKMPLLAVGEKSFSNFELAQIIQKQVEGVAIRFLGEDFSTSFEYNNVETKKALTIEENFSFESALNQLIEWKGKQF
ncbi:SDR family oxidoreductase [Flavobacterium sp. SM15]|uniref:SDR family oxidoreductase n=1 Tax=Flavobacterium sp. SM15 TaxID=2908005 RepID=UPI001EDC4DC2|nr:SDR family oxidoreductase [Flavobacterium sp. SM15]MCG2611263.1 SDR family oxidoreductase [Flavobacterium sp. SM15]